MCNKGRESQVSCLGAMAADVTGTLVVCYPLYPMIPFLVIFVILDQAQPQAGTNLEALSLLAMGLQT